MTATKAELVAMLRQLEWIWSAGDVGDFEVCPVCHRYRERGPHHDDCELAALIARDRGFS